MAQVLLLPGLFGSQMSRVTFGLVSTYRNVFWPPTFQTGRGGLVEFQLDAEGVLPGPLTEGIPMDVGDPIAEYYGPLAAAIAAGGHTVVSVGWDWRKSFRLAAQRVYLALREAFPVGPVQIVAHSAGGLIAKAVCGIAASHGLTTYIDRIIYLGTPQYGSFETYRVWWGLSDLYKRIIRVSGWGPLIEGQISPAYLDATIATWPSFYEVMPYRNSGPLFDADPAQARNLYTLAEYNPVPATAQRNAYITQARLDAAPPEQDALAGQPAGVRGYLIRGTDFETARSRKASPFVPWRASAYDYTQDGDSYVSVPEGTLAGLPGTTFSVTHNDLPLARVVKQWVVQLLATG